MLFTLAAHSTIYFSHLCSYFTQPHSPFYFSVSQPLSAEHTSSPFPTLISISGLPSPTQYASAQRACITIHSAHAIFKGHGSCHSQTHPGLTKKKEKDPPPNTGPPPCNLRREARLCPPHDRLPTTVPKPLKPPQNPAPVTSSHHQPFTSNTCCLSLHQLQRHPQGLGPSCWPNNFTVPHPLLIFSPQRFYHLHHC
ncbi:hypothetical protein VNO80_23693 [Phaseolus coccineus]|uniref:Uncharacterized protein n=1 Tax=Phaseolus coccineus TaxID=3886 RepID=A0AAN9QZS4_PHACN